jgi:hypothetical protein
VGDLAYVGFYDKPLLKFERIRPNEHRIADTQEA